MILLDTDHTSVLKYPDSERCRHLQTRLALRIALATRSLLLTANTSDFKQVPGLAIDNWMD